MELDAYLLAFGAHQMTATRANVIEGALDRGAAIAHEHYMKGLSGKGAMSLRDLQAATRDWADVLETYRAANRAVADAAMVKLWDAGFAPAPKGEKGKAEPALPDDLVMRMAEREHDRWMAERLISGWRPTIGDEARNDDIMAHDKIVPWAMLTDADKQKDAVQVRAGIDIARLMHPDGFVRR